MEDIRENLSLVVSFLKYMVLEFSGLFVFAGTFMLFVGAATAWSDGFDGASSGLIMGLGLMAIGRFLQSAKKKQPNQAFEKLAWGFLITAWFFCSMVGGFILYHFFFSPQGSWPSTLLVYTVSVFIVMKAIRATVCWLRKHSKHLGPEDD
jgi:hypothetical protein